MSLTIDVCLVLPIYARSEANRRDNRFAKARRVKEQRGVVAAMLRPLFPVPPDAAVTIRLTRIRKRGARPLDDDNLRSSLKAVRDGVADALGIDDGDSRLTWWYAQETGADYAVRIEVWA